MYTDDGDDPHRVQHKRIGPNWRELTAPFAYTCLFAAHGHDFRELLRGGASDQQIAGRLASVWQGRTDRYSERRTAATATRPKVEMSYIGG